jgi:uncharacterized protein YbjQ (UPF0145 family)
MIVTTTENVAGHRTIEALGQVFGVVVRSRSIGGNLAAAIDRSAAARSRNIPPSSRKPGGMRSIVW